MGFWLVGLAVACGRPASSPLPAGVAITQLAAGNYAACARRGDGAVLCWGRCGRACGSMPGPEGEAPSAPPGVIRGVDRAVHVAVGESSACAARDDGSVWCWGDNYDGSLGHADVEARGAAPAAVPGVTGAVEIVATGAMMCARRRDGTVVSWGGKLHSADDTPAQRVRRMPTPIADVAGAEALFVQDNACCARVASGGVGCWSGEVVDTGREGYQFHYRRPSRVGDAHTRAAFDCGCLLDDRGALSCSSAAFPGARTTSGDSSSVPNGCSIGRLKDIATAAPRLASACAVRVDGSVLCWGQGQRAQPIALATRAKQIVVTGMGTTYILDVDGAVWGFGAATESAIPGRVGNVDSPVRVLP
jgi:hypothetical protein